MVAIRRIQREPEVVWRTANPIWREYDESDPNARFRMRTPFLTRFQNDRFIEDFVALLQRAPSRLHEWEVGKETWRMPMPAASVDQPAANRLPPSVPAELQNEPLKLYQPVHERYYLVTASLVCRIPGLPDKMLDTSANERATFVIRRKMRTANSNLPVEHAFVNGMWVAVDDPKQLQRNAASVPEEQYPLFPASYTDDLTGMRRRLFAGLIPVSQREKLLTAGKEAALRLSSGAGDASAGALSRTDQLMTVFDLDVLAPWRQLLREIELPPPPPTPENANPGKLPGYAFYNIEQAFDNSSGDDRAKALTELMSSTRDVQQQLQTSTWYILLDFAQFLNAYLPNVLNKIRNSSVSLSGKQKALYDLLAATYFAPISEPRTFDTKTEFKGLLEGTWTNTTSLATAIRLAWDARDALEGTDGTQPTTPFLLTGLDVRQLVNGEGTDLGQVMREALATTSAPAGERIPQIPAAATISESITDGDYDDNTFIVRCVFERPNCPPGVHPAVISEPTQAFTMASFFDPDAPARPIRIPMPIDTTPSGLRKFAKNTMFVLSDTLACQVEAARKITFADLVLSVLPWPFHKDLPDVNAGACKPGINIGMLCTLSIPIITIVALILLIIMVLLLNSIFFWIPFLIFCLPLPGLIAKKD